MAEWVKWTNLALRETKLISEPINQAYLRPKTFQIVDFHYKNLFYTEKKCLRTRKMKGYMKKKASFFKKGNNLNRRRRKIATKKEENVDSEVCYVRPSVEEANLVDQNPIESLAMTSEASKRGTAPTYRRLRTKTPKQPDCTCESYDAKIQRQFEAGYRLLHSAKLWEMFNTVSKEHRQHSHDTCKGNLMFDQQLEKKWGVCWLEIVKCDSCTYRSDRFKLYEEVAGSKRGRKAATANVGLGVGMTQTSSGPTGVIKLCASINIPPPSRQGLQKTSKSVSKIIEKTNIEDMRTRRQQLKTINKLRNMPENEIVVQSDGVYNNNLYSGVGKTPFQPGTQCTYTVAENVTSKKQIIAVETVNKLCSKHGFHSIEDEPCDIKSDSCSATAAMESSIGNEGLWAKNCLMQLKDDDLEVKYIVTDPDTSAYKASDELFQAGFTKTEPVHQIDTRHLSQNHRKYIKNSESVLSMMPGQTKAYRLYLRNRFAEDLRKRCQAEHTVIHKSEKGDFKEVSRRVGLCVSAIKKCYAGDHSRCKLYSSVCKGELSDNWIYNSDYLSKTFKLDLSQERNEQCLSDCIAYRLADDMLQKTRLNLNTQKVEGTNRALKRSLPKGVTFSRSYPGRAHSAIHSVNNGMGTSLMKLCTAAGCPIESKSRTGQFLTNMQRQAENKKRRELSLTYQTKRRMRRVRLFGMYENHQEKNKYIKAQLLKNRQANLRRQKKLCDRRKSVNAKDHIYSRNPKRSRNRSTVPTKTDK